MTVTIDGERIHYDANTKLHGHFRCISCGEIYDFDIEPPKDKGLDGFTITQKDVYYSGVCPHCANNLKD